MKGIPSVCPVTKPAPAVPVEAPPPQRVRDVMERLKDGLDRGWIPGWLWEPIEEDLDFGY